MLLVKIPQPIKCVCLDYSFMTLHNKAQVVYFFMHKIMGTSVLDKEGYFGK